jgi:hypothetical protein
MEQPKHGDIKTGEDGKQWIFLFGKWREPANDSQEIFVAPTQKSKLRNLKFAIINFVYRPLWTHRYLWTRYVDGRLDALYIIGVCPDAKGKWWALYSTPSQP